MSRLSRHSIMLAITMLCIAPAASAIAQFRFSGSKARGNQQSNQAVRTPTVRKPNNSVNRFSRLPSLAPQTKRQTGTHATNTLRPFGQQLGNVPSTKKPPQWNFTPNRLTTNSPPTRKPNAGIDLGRIGQFKPPVSNNGPLRKPQPDSNALKPPIRRPKITIDNAKPPTGTLLPGKPGPFSPGPIGPSVVSKNPPVQLGSGQKLQGIKLFEGFLSKQDNKKLAPVKLNKFDGKFATLMKPANLKINPVQHQAAKKFAVKKLSLQPKCHWWIDFVIGCNWQWNHCHWWDHCYQPGYWQCWTPCHYQVVYCPAAPGFASTSWYFGVECILIPDMAAYGIQEVKPNSPAAFAGLKPGDLIVSINGYAIDDESVLANAIRTSGGHLQLGIIRDGGDQPVIVDVALLQIQKLSY